MPSTPQLILAAPPSQVEQARRSGLAVAPMAYGLGQDFTLLGAALPHCAWNAPMVLRVQGNPPPPSRFPQRAEALVQLCRRAGYPGLWADWPRQPTAALTAFTGVLGTALATQGLSLWLPLAWADTCPTAGLVVSSALSGGTLRGRLTQLTAQYGRERLVLLLRRSCTLFSLPASRGQGTPVEPSSVAARIQRGKRFFSPDLCAHYVTWQEGGGVRLLLFDDAASLRAKLSLAGELGLSHCAAFYPEVAELLPDLTGRR